MTLSGHLTMEPGVVREEHGPHAAAAEQALEPVVPQGHAGCEAAWLSVHHLTGSVVSAAVAWEVWR